MSDCSDGISCIVSHEVGEQLRIAIARCFLKRLTIAHCKRTNP